MNVVPLPKGIRLCLDGDLTVSNAAALRNALLEALGQSDQVEIDLDGITAVDLAGLQLLCAAHRTALAKGKTLTLRDMQVPALMQARAVSGFVFHRSCRFNPAGDCYWVGGIE